jgi:hypothetical protein
MVTSENTVLVSFNVQLRSKQIVPWTILPVVLFVCQNSRFEPVCVMFLNQRLSKLVHVTGTLENLNLAVNLKFFILQ